MAWCAQCTCCEVRRSGDLCIFCQDGLVCPRRRNKQRLAKAAAAILQPKTADPSRAEEERDIRKTARDVERRHQREERQKLREARRKRSADRILADRQTKERIRAEKKLKRRVATFISAVASAELPPERVCKDCGDPIPNANLCEPCKAKRRKAGGAKRKKYNFTPEQDARIREMYEKRVSNRFSLKATLASEFGFPDWAARIASAERLSRMEERRSITAISGDPWRDLSLRRRYQFIIASRD
jgi:hypothetical protein